jgi:hypothetical protein
MPFQDGQKWSQPALGRPNWTLGRETVGPFAADPAADPNLWGADGNVLSMARSGNTLYIAGSFRSVGENTGGFVPVDAQVGEPLSPFPKVAGSVGVIVPDGSGGWYIGGEFTAVGGKARSCLAQIRADGGVSDWNPGVTGSPGFIDPPAVAAIAVIGDRVYVGGAFGEIGGLQRENLGCVDGYTGAVVDWNPGTHVDGFVDALAVHENAVFVGGSFSTIGGQPRSNLAAADAMSGLVTPWRADAVGRVMSLLVREDTLYVAGEFGGIAGGARSMVAAIHANTGQLLQFDARASGVYPNQYVPLPQVDAMALVGDTLYVGGDFTAIGGQPQGSLAALNATTGDALPWTPPTFGPQYSGFPPPMIVTLAPSGGTLYIGGGFETAGGQSRPFAAALDRVTGAVTEWNPKPDLPPYSLIAKGGTVYVGGVFSMVGEWKHRAGLAAIDVGTGALKPWNPNPDGEIVTALAVSGDRVFVSGDFSNIGGQPLPRSYFAALDTISGEATGWNPGANSLADVLLLQGDTLYAGGEFTQVGGQQRNYLAAIRTTTGEVTAWDPSANLPVLAMARNAGTIYVGGIFDHVGGQGRRGIAAIDGTAGTLTSWNPDTDNSAVDALLAIGNTVYVGGGFGQIGGETRNAIAALDAGTGHATAWYPQASGWGSPTRVRALALVEGALYVGGDFAIMGGQPRICLAAVDTSTALATPWDAGLNGLVWSLAGEGNAVYAGGGFTRAGRLPAAGLAAFSLPGNLAAAPASFALAQSLPNPARSSALIRFTLPAPTPVTVSVYDLQGRLVAILLDHVLQSAGRHELALRVDEWKPGIYLYRLEAQGLSATRKMVVIE